MIIHLGHTLPHGSSGLPESAAVISHNNERAAHIDAFLFGLAPRGVYLAGRVTTAAGELLPHRFTHYPGKPGLEYSLLHLSFPRQIGRPGSYPARCPTVFGLSSSAKAKAIIRRALLKAKKL